MEDLIYIFGHKNPDTDSVCSAIGLSYLQNALGYNTIPCILSPINEETSYVLKKFKFNTPSILNDVKLQIKDINYHKNFKVDLKESVYNAFFLMQDENMSTIPVVSGSGEFMGAFAMKDIAKKEILGDNKYLKTSYNHILKTIEGTSILKFNDEIEGEITNISIRSSAVYDSDIFNKNTILIIGDRHSVIEDAIRKKVKLIVVTAGKKIKEEHLELAEKNKVNIIYTNKSSYDTLLTINFANYIESYRYTKDLYCVSEDTYITDFNEIVNKTRHSYYPIIDKHNHCLGLIKLSDLRDAKPKQVFLVDHNEISQSVEGLEEAKIMGILDHHKLGTLGTMEPINFRNMIVGSTSTIVYELYKENKVKIPNNIASLLMAGIISDTLLLKSPTTTNVDEKALNDLVKITGIDPENLAIEMFKANDAIKSKSVKDIIYMDFKTFNLDKNVIAISQVTTLNAKAILKQKNSYIRYLNREANSKGYDVMILVITDIFKNGSYLLFNEKSKDILSEAYNKNMTQGLFMDSMVSRKKQILPPIIGVIK